MSLSPTTEALADEDAAVAAAVAHAHGEIADRYGIDPAEVHKQEICQVAARLVVKHLVEVAGRPATLDERGFHSYVELSATGRIADSTWQLFLESEPSTEPPETLIGTRDEVVAQAKSYGITSESVLNGWRARQTPRSSQVVMPSASSRKSSRS